VRERERGIDCSMTDRAAHPTATDETNVPPPNVPAPITADQRSQPLSWRRVFVTGAILFVATAWVLLQTGNPNLYPTVVLLGSFLVPVTFVFLLYDHQHWSTLSFESIVRAFVYGGTLGILGASALEPLLLPRIVGESGGGLGLTGALAVGAIEEGSKLVAVMLVARGMRHIGALDGLILGAAVGMGFAALESSGYAFTALITSGGDVIASLQLTIIRAILSPFGHGTWTAIAAAALFHESDERGYRITPLVVGAFVFVTVLHGIWDGLDIGAYLSVLDMPLSISVLIAGVVGIAVLVAAFRLCERQQGRVAAEGRLPAVGPFP